MGRRLRTIIAGLAVVALIVVAVVALTTQPGEASAQIGVQGTSAATTQRGSASQDCDECTGQGDAQGSGDGAARGCDRCGAQSTGQAGDSGGGDSCGN